ncbi:MAG: hypothetical protein WCV69_00775 [Patescibacteria group bacterium]|jgi:hypothetical protein
MDNNQKISKIKEIYNNFLLAVNKLKQEAISRRQKKSEASNKAEIDDILNKINSNF